jgi:hypothetical protein
LAAAQPGVVVEVVGACAAWLQQSGVCAGEPSWWDGSAYLWDNGISAVTTDAFGVEVWPPDVSPATQPFGLFHRILIGQLGLALGELRDLGALAADCRDHGIFECMLVSAPLYLPGGVRSPVNALAFDSARPFPAENWPQVHEPRGELLWFATRRHIK